MFKISYASSNLAKKKPPSPPVNSSSVAAPSSKPAAKKRPSSANTTTASNSSSFARPTAASSARAAAISSSTTSSSLSNIYSDDSSSSTDHDQRERESDRVSSISTISSVSKASSTKQKQQQLMRPSTKRSKQSKPPLSTDISLGSISTISSAATTTVSSNNNNKASKKISLLSSSQSPRRDPPPAPIRQSAKVKYYSEFQDSSINKSSVNQQVTKKISPRRTVHHHHLEQEQNNNNEKGDTLNDEPFEDDDALLQVAKIVYTRNILQQMTVRAGIHRANRFAELLHAHHQKTSTRSSCLQKWKSKFIENRLRSVQEYQRKKLLTSCYSHWNEKYIREFNCRQLKSHLESKHDQNLPRNCFMKWRNEMLVRRQRPIVRVTFNKWKGKALNRVMVERLVDSLQHRCWNQWKLRLVQRQNEVFAKQIERRVTLWKSFACWKDRFFEKMKATEEELMIDVYWKRSCFAKWRRKYRDSVEERKFKFQMLAEKTGDDDGSEEEEEELFEEEEAEEQTAASSLHSSSIKLDLSHIRL